MLDINVVNGLTFTYDHRLERIGHPVRSAIHKLQIGRLVVGWVTTSEYLLLYVFVLFFLFCSVLFLVFCFLVGETWEYTRLQNP